MPKTLKAAKTIALACFLVLLACTYLLRTQVLHLNEIRLSADQARAEAGLTAFLEGYDARKRAYDAERAIYERDMALFTEDMDAYLQEQADRRMSGRFLAPQPPREPQAPEVTRELARINAEFRDARHSYFVFAGRLNILASIAGLGLVGSLVYLLMNDPTTSKWVYLGVLSLAFVFLIGPSFHTVLSSIVSALRPPPYESLGYGYQYAY
ncbi:MAG: hypothetical protein ACTS27_07255 [Phycisphaerales bacterium]